MVSVESLVIVVGLVSSAILLISVRWLTRNRTPSAPSSAETPDTAGGTDTSTGRQRSDDSSSATARDTATAGGDGDTEAVQHAHQPDSVDGSSDSQADSDTATQVYDPDVGTRAGTQVWLHIEGDRIEIPTGVAVGRELRRHLVDQGVAKQRALAISRDHFIVESVDGELKLQDLDSTGGTVLDGTRLPPEQWTSLADGDEVVLAGELRGRFEVA